jgi:hypothetical protein
MPRKYTIHEDGTVEVHHSSDFDAAHYRALAIPSVRSRKLAPCSEWCGFCGTAHEPSKNEEALPHCQTPAGALRMGLTRCRGCSLFVGNIFKHQRGGCRKIPFSAAGRGLEPSGRAGVVANIANPSNSNKSGRAKRKKQRAQTTPATPGSPVQTRAPANNGVSSKPKSHVSSRSRTKCGMCAARPKDMAKHIRKAHKSAISPVSLPAEERTPVGHVESLAPELDSLAVVMETTFAVDAVERTIGMGSLVEGVSPARQRGFSTPGTVQAAVARNHIDAITICPDCGLFVVLSMLALHHQSRHEAPPLGGSLKSESTMTQEYGFQATSTDYRVRPSGLGHNEASVRATETKGQTKSGRANPSTGGAQDRPAAQPRGLAPDRPEHRHGGSQAATPYEAAPWPNVSAELDRDVVFDPWTGKPMSVSGYRRRHALPLPTPGGEHQVYSKRVTHADVAQEYKRRKRRPARVAPEALKPEAPVGPNMAGVGNRRVEAAQALDEARTDGSLRLGYLAREEGRFGSLSSWDNYSDESKP